MVIFHKPLPEGINHAGEALDSEDSPRSKKRVNADGILPKKNVIDLEKCGKMSGKCLVNLVNVGDNDCIEMVYSSINNNVEIYIYTYGSHSTILRYGTPE